VSGLASLGHALAFAVGAGINLYATVLVIGLAARFEWVDLPASLDLLGSSWVIGVAAVLYLLEFLADKIPWVDSLWDGIHTLVRPVGAAVIAVAALGPASPGMEVAAGLLGAAIGASTHAAKAGTRLAVNASPEPASNIAISLFEDGFVVGLVLLLITHPLLGLGLALVALLAVAVVLWVLLRVLLRRRRARREHRVR
jgi:hypothetical protein